MAQLGNLGHKKVEVSAKIQTAKKIDDAESRWRQQWFNAKQLVERVPALARALSSIVTAKKSVEGLPWRDNELANLAAGWALPVSDLFPWTANSRWRIGMFSAADEAAQA